MVYAVIPSFKAEWEEISPSEGKTEIKDRVFVFQKLSCQ